MQCIDVPEGSAISVADIVMPTIAPRPFICLVNSMI